MYIACLWGKDADVRRRSHTHVRAHTYFFLDNIGNGVIFCNEMRILTIVRSFALLTDI